ncbi:hypothetical protein G4Y79_15290 [Phototrophicus methaneseepsis]|uniref:Phage protein n=1 Tax=Phototrophicus methaneseepsis TaxID=2710758 RepID=A0A7S8E644_9CHLR|nr:hypothetical protein [Phototrophicus methaneseepsis]QPC81067.1 hypothetical protein G4Y79_15290 [Phototrophicus methaneseepsis]
MRPETQRMMQRAVLRRLTQTCEIRRNHAPVPDGYGGYQEPRGYDRIVSACFLVTDSRRQRDAGVAGADVGQVFYVLQLPYDTDIQDGDVVIVDDKQFEVAQAVVEHSNDVMRQARLVRAGE